MRRHRKIPMRKTAPASVLLEVLVTVTIIAMFMSLIGGQILSSIRAAGKIESRQTAMFLTESIVSRLQAGGVPLGDQAQQTFSDNFGTVYPEWSWQVLTEPTEDQNVRRVTMQVFRSDSGTALTSFEGVQPVTELTTFLTIPRKVDLVADMGMSEEDAARMAAMVGGIDPRAMDPQLLAKMNLKDLAGMLPQLETLLSQYGLNMADLNNMDTLRTKLEPLLAGMGGLDAITGALGDKKDGTNDAKNPDQPQGKLDFSELIRLGEGGNVQAMQDWIEAHKDQLGAMGGAGTGGGR